MGKNFATEKNIFALKAKRDIWRNSDAVLSREFLYIVRMTRALRDFYVRWGHLKDFTVNLSVMTDISGNKAQAFQWYYETLHLLYPDKNFDQIFQDSMIEDTKTAIAMNSFINFISKTFESYIEV